MRQPVVLAIEDLHWADPTTLDVLRGIAGPGALAPLFIVATTRPEFRPPWDMRSHHATVSLAPLDRPQVRDVAACTGGVPLFVEEVTRLLLERGDKGGIHVIPLQRVPSEVSIGHVRAARHVTSRPSSTNYAVG